ncbi:carbohydrate ABC transporter permease [Anaerocolumna aminovalerica]|uniref:Carbohydrate ABC transporter membrane protein 2, CUT1 family n=1 Tax=Anaerocolumna aminovalerica TaxID=1527 RepID=A0A1I5D0C8_9FIRM|nr:carbohydrate ABC transporter permease [Anaerocolumna aminovalerica]SFN92664.1 carbohydrate ABC transporter membrane protein 2, CUT1 family [Anaerocolumna aminovalerica]
MKHQRRKIRRTAEDKVMDTVIFILMTLILLVTLYPFYYVIIISFNDGVDALNGGIYFWPRKFTLANYQQFLSDAKWLHALLISILKTVAGTTLTILFTCMVGYGLSAPNLMFRKFYNVVLLVCMYFSGGLIPYYLVLNSYGLLNTFWVYVIPTMFSTYYCILAISFFREIPYELYESARLDGAKEIRIYTSIVLPLSKPLIATLGLFAAVGQWNAWSDTAFFAPGKKSLRTLAFLMRDVITKNQVDVTSKAAMMQASRYGQVTTTSVQMAAMIITILPIVLVYPFLQKHFVKGIMLGAVKG